jgi:molybdopterin converting factor subunit 1
MEVAIKLFAIFRDRIGANEITVTLPDRSTASDLISAVVERHPDLAPFASRVAVAVNLETVSRSTVIESGDEVALIPPVSGGRHD